MIQNFEQPLQVDYKPIQDHLRKFIPHMLSGKYPDLEGIGYGLNDKFEPCLIIDVRTKSSLTYYQKLSVNDDEFRQIISNFPCKWNVSDTTTVL